MEVGREVELDPIPQCGKAEPSGQEKSGLRVSPSADSCLIL